jgi:hypothetical protein
MTPRAEANLGAALLAAGVITAMIIAAILTTANDPRIMIAGATATAGWILLEHAERRRQRAAARYRHPSIAGGRIVTGGSTATIHRREEHR